MRARPTHLPADVPLFDVPETVEQYHDLWRHFESLKQRPDDTLWLESVRTMAMQDLFVMLRYVLSTRNWYRKDGTNGCDRQFVIDRCRDVETRTDGVLDVWAREHFKSSIKSKANHFRRLACDPEQTICILSNKYATAAKLLRGLKLEMETNPLLHLLWPEVFWANPKQEAPKWGERDGLIISRQGNPLVASIEAHGLTDGMPIGSHFSILSYDDVITSKDVTSQDVIASTNEALDLSKSLGSEGCTREYTGTYYSNDDPHYHLQKVHGVEVRHWPCCPITQDEPLGDISKGYLYPRSYLEEQRKVQISVWSCQWLCSPSAGMSNRLEVADLRFYGMPPADMAKDLNIYLLVDPASEKKRSDYTAMGVVGLSPSGHYIVLDIIRDRFNVWDRINRTFELVRKWKPLQVRYERYSMQADVELLESEMEKRKVYFDLVEVAGNASKNDRIATRFGAIVSQRRFILPRTLTYIDKRGDAKCMVRSFIDEEFKLWPASSNDDLLDMFTRIEEPGLYNEWPADITKREEEDPYALAEQKAIEQELGNDGPGWLGVM